MYEVFTVSKSDDYPGISGSADDEIYWQDAIEAFMNQRPDMMPKCHWCKGVIAITQEGRKTRLECGGCKRFLEGRFTDEEHNVRPVPQVTTVQTTKKT